MGHNAHLNTSLFTVLKDYTRVNTFIKIRWIILQPQPLIFTLSNSLICYSFKTVWSDIFLLDFHDSAHIYWEKIHLTSVICQFCGYQIALNQFLSSRNTYIWQFWEIYQHTVEFIYDQLNDKTTKIPSKEFISSISLDQVSYIRSAENHYKIYRSFFLLLRHYSCAFFLFLSFFPSFLSTINRNLNDAFKSLST